MIVKFKQFSPDELFITSYSEASESDSNTCCNKKSGYEVLDMFVNNLNRYGLIKRGFHSRLLGISQLELAYCVQTLTGYTYSDFVYRYIMLMANEMLTQPGKINYNAVAKRLGYQSYSGFYRFVTSKLKEKPSWII